MEAMKREVSKNSPSLAFRKVSSDAGGVLGAQQPGQLPRSRQQMYDLKYKLDKTDQVDQLLIYAKQKDEPIILEHHDVPEDLWVLGKSHMCQDLSRFCCSEVRSHPFSVDPTFNFGKFEVTPYSYKHLLLKSTRTKEAPVFVGPTAIHYSKKKNVFQKIASTVATSSPGLAAKGRGFITDGENALHDALGESLKKAKGLRCFNQFRKNCKDKLHAVGIQKQQDQKFFLDMVFGNGPEAVLDGEDKSDLKARLKAAQQALDEEEKRLTGTASPQFWVYLSNHEKMIKKSMIATVRKQAGMPSDSSGKPQRCYTNQSESVNNKLTRQKEALTKDKGKSNLTKLEFVREVWEEVDQQQQLELKMAVCGMSQEYELADAASYLEVELEVWFDWSEKKKTRDEYMRKFNELTMEDVTRKKAIAVNKQHEETMEWREFSEDMKSLFSIKDLSEGLFGTIVKEAEKLLNTPNTIQRMPSLSAKDLPAKYLVAAKNCKRGLYECTVHATMSLVSAHVTSTIPYANTVFVSRKLWAY